jgi:hypothetical protein
MFIVRQDMIRMSDREMPERIMNCNPERKKTSKAQSRMD